MEVAKYINEIIVLANEVGVSDIHFHPIEDHVEIDFRLNGIMCKDSVIKEEEFKQVLRYLKYICKLDVGIAKKPLDGSFEAFHLDAEVSVRISIIPLVKGESLVIRLLSEIPEFANQNVVYNPLELEKMYSSIVNSNGLFVVTGPTGSGKSTTMYQLLKRATKDKQRKIICIEDPVEIVCDEFTQIQIDEKKGLTYSIALKACLRHDPDIIMIGEIRDQETAESVMRATLTGHTVISTMHTKNKYGVIERLLDFDFKISEIKSVLIGISNQRLVFNNEGERLAFYDVVVEKELEILYEAGEKNDIYDKLKETQLEINKQ